MMWIYFYRSLLASFLIVVILVNVFLNSNSSQCCQLSNALHHIILAEWFVCSEISLFKWMYRKEQHHYQDQGGRDEMILKNCPPPVDFQAKHPSDVIFLSQTRTTWPYNPKTQFYEIPYVDNLSSVYTVHMLKIIRFCMAYIESITFIKFIPVEAGVNTNKLIFEASQTCESTVGRFTASKDSILRLNSQLCSQIGYVMHEFLHLLGLSHVHERVDHNHYIIQTNCTLKFKIKARRCPNILDLPYDLSSLTHYDMYAPCFAYNDAAFLPKDPAFLLLAATVRALPSSCEWSNVFQLYPDPFLHPIPYYQKNIQCRPHCLSTEIRPSKLCIEHFDQVKCTFLCYLHSGKLLPIKLCALNIRRNKAKNQIPPCISYEEMLPYFNQTLTQEDFHHFFHGIPLVRFQSTLKNLTGKP